MSKTEIDYKGCWELLKLNFIYTERNGTNFQQSMAQAMIDEMNKIEEKCQKQK